jgi:gamma-glutamyltranspeptidase/glutathione hydrolase
MHRRTFLATLPALASAGALAQTRSANPNRNRRDVGFGDRVDGATFATRSAVWGVHGAAATSHPLATLAGIEILKAGGSAVDAAIAANACLGVLEPTANGIGGDAFAMLWDPAVRKVIGLNGSGRSPAGLSLETVRSRAKKGSIPSHGAICVSVPGTVDAWWQLHQKYGKLPWSKLFGAAITYAQEGAPVAQTVAYYLNVSFRRFTSGELGIEEVENFRRIWAPEGHAPREGDVFRNPALARTLALIAKDGRDAFYKGEIGDVIDAYFRRIGGWLTKEDLAAHTTEWTQPIVTNYRGADVYGLAPNTQGLTTLQILNIMETFDVSRLGFQSAPLIHHFVEAKRLAFEDRARFFADPALAQTPIEWLNSKQYAKARAKLIRPNRILTPVHAGEAPGKGDTTYLCTADAQGMMVSLIQSNYSGMGSGLMPDGLGFMLHNRGTLFALADGHPNLYAPRKRPFHTIIPGFAVKNGEPWLAFGVMGGDMQPQGQAQVISNFVDFGLAVQEAGDAPRWHHEGSGEPTGQAQSGVGLLRLETGIPARTRKALAALGWKPGESDGGFGRYQAIERWPGRYAAAADPRADGAALAY